MFNVKIVNIVFNIIPRYCFEFYLSNEKQETSFYIRCFQYSSSIGTYCSQGTTNIFSSSTICKEVPPKGGRKTQNIFSFLFFLEFFSLENDRGKNEVRQIRSGDKRRVEQR